MARRPGCAGDVAREGRVRWTMGCRCRGFGTLGFSRKQQPHWDWMVDRIRLVKAAGETPRVLNLFGYTGAASLLAAAEGAEWTHVDASKRRSNGGRTIRPLRSSALPPFAGCGRCGEVCSSRGAAGENVSFILVDPPKFGRGPDGEVWDLFTSLPPLLDTCVQLLAPERAAMVLTVYAIRASVLASIR